MLYKEINVWTAIIWANAGLLSIKTLVAKLS